MSRALNFSQPPVLLLIRTFPLLSWMCRPARIGSRNVIDQATFVLGHRQLATFPVSQIITLPLPPA